MADREKVLKGLECCMKWTGEPNTATCHCSDCSYTNMDIFGQRCLIDLINDALALLKDQEAKWVEDKQGERCRLIKCSNCGLTFIVGNNIPYDEWIEDRNYCRRCGARMVKRND